jgi:hypothetical protein
MGRFPVRQTLAEWNAARKSRRDGFPTGGPFSLRPSMRTETPQVLDGLMRTRRPVG